MIILTNNFLVWCCLFLMLSRSFRKHLLLVIHNLHLWALFDANLGNYSAEKTFYLETVYGYQAPLSNTSRYLLESLDAEDLSLSPGWSYEN